MCIHTGPTGGDNPTAPILLPFSVLPDSCSVAACYSYPPPPDWLGPQPVDRLRVRVLPARRPPHYGRQLRQLCGHTLHASTSSRHTHVSLMMLRTIQQTINTRVAVPVTPQPACLPPHTSVPNATWLPAAAGTHPTHELLTLSTGSSTRQPCTHQPLSVPPCSVHRVTGRPPRHRPWADSCPCVMYELVPGPNTVLRLAWGSTSATPPSSRGTRFPTFLGAVLMSGQRAAPGCCPPCSALPTAPPGVDRPS